MSRTGMLTPGDSAPWFVGNCTANPALQFDTVAGRKVVLCFFGSTSLPASSRVLDDFLAARDTFDGTNACFFGVSTDPEDQRSGNIQALSPGVRFYWDTDSAISRRYGAVQQTEHGETFHPHTLLLDERLRVVAVFPLDPSPETHAGCVLDALRAMPPAGSPTWAPAQAPVLIVPRLFEPELCRTLVTYYEERGGEESGIVREVGGRTVPMTDPTFKRRRDREVTDEAVRKSCMARIRDRLLPEIHKSFQFRATRMERCIVACYDAVGGGFFRSHRDNTMKGTAHRRFAVSVNLNTGEYEGGCLRFPEFGPQFYVPPAGGAVVFSCSLLHEVTPVTEGKRYAFLPFLYDKRAARIRRQNLAYLDETAREYTDPADGSTSGP